MAKASTGFLTPQGKKHRKSVMKRSESISGLVEKPELELEALLSCPVKRQFILNLINNGGDNTAAHEKKKKNQEQRNSPVLKLIKRYACESPTALLRRRALEQLNAGPDPYSEGNEVRSTSSCGSEHGSEKSAKSDVSSSAPSPIPFERIMEGVIAYVDINKNGQDKSAGAKAVLRAMGATVRDTFTKDVSHVVFKDGNYSTFQKAQLKKVHLVSVLWIDFSRKNLKRQDEKMYPALGCYENTSAVCSQLFKEYEDIIKEEYQRSVMEGVPFPTTKTLIDRRRTLMTPSVSCSQEVENIFSNRRVLSSTPLNKTVQESPSVVDDSADDDSDVGPIINGNIVDNTNKNHPLQSVENIIELNKSLSSQDSRSLITGNITRRHTSYMELTCLLNVDKTGLEKRNNTAGTASPKANKEAAVKEVISTSSDKSTNISKSPVLSRGLSTGSDRILSRNSCNQPIQLKNNLPVGDGTTSTIMPSLKMSDMSTNSSDRSKTNTNMSSLKMSDKNASNSGRNKMSTSMSSLKMSDVSTNSSDRNKTSTNMSSLKMSDKSASNSDKNKISSSMSSLKISDKSASSSDRNKISTNMSLLQISDKDSNKSIQNTSNNQVSASKRSLGSDFSSCNDLQVILEPGVINKALVAVASPMSESFSSNITIRRKTKRNLPDSSLVPAESLSSASDCLDDSEIISPIKKKKQIKSSKDSEVQHRKAKDNPKRNKKESSTKEFGKNSNKEKEKQVSPAVKNTPRRSIRVRRPTAVFTPTTNRKNDTQNCNKTTPVPNEKIFTNVENPTKEINKKVPPHKDSDTGTDSTDDVTKKNKKLRKLYNPDESIAVEICDEDEREQKRKARKKKKDTGVFINPAAIDPKLLFSTRSPYKDKEGTDENIDMTNEKNTKAKKKKVDKRVSINSSDDEQDGLLSFIKKNNTQKTVAVTRKSCRPSKKIKNPTKLKSSSSDEPMTPKIRRSTLEFQTASKRTKLKKLNHDKPKEPTIVCTKLHHDDVVTFSQIVKKLGGFVVEDEVSSHTTHVVAGEPKRTINMLRAMIRGCWILKHEWLLKSLEEGRWLPEEDYEELRFSPHVQKNRIQRQAFGPKYTMDVFQNSETIYVARSSNPRCSDLRELIALCKGKVVKDPAMAKIIVAEQFEGVTCVKETWILDCITFNRLMPFKKYLLLSPSNKRKSLIV